MGLIVKVDCKAHFKFSSHRLPLEITKVQYYDMQHKNHGHRSWSP